MTPIGARTPCRFTRMSGFGTLVWTGRALQVGFEQMEGGLALLYPALAWSDCAPGHHGYAALTSGE